MIVTDTNTIAYLLIDGRETEDCKTLLLRDSYWRAPFLWRSEFGNVLVQHVKKGFIPPEEAETYMKKALELMGGGEEDQDPGEVLRLSQESGCSYYHCEFAALALALGCPLITSDRKLLKAFKGWAFKPGDYQ